MYPKGTLPSGAAGDVQSRQAIFVRCCLNFDGQSLSEFLGLVLEAALINQIYYKLKRKGREIITEKIQNSDDSVIRAVKRLTICSNTATINMMDHY